MNDVCLTMIRMSLSASVIAFLLLALKPIIKNKMTKTIQYYSWLVVLLLLIIPITIELPGQVHNQNRQQIAAPFTIYNTVERLAVTKQENIKVINKTDTSANQALKGDDKSTTSPVSIDFTTLMTMLLWAFGVVVFLVINLVGYFRFLIIVKRGNRPIREADKELIANIIGRRPLRIYRNTTVQTPMLLGILSPTILLPDRDYNRTQLSNILSHEMTHYKRFDLLIKWLFLIVNALHWFNPVIYLIRKEVERACELSCDEMVIRNLSNNEKQAYGETLLTIAEERHYPTGALSVTMCEEKRSLKERLIAIMRNGRKSKWTAVISITVIFIIITGVVFTCAKITDNLAKSVDLNGLKNIKNMAVPPEIDYASDNRVIFHSQFGLFVYDTKQQKLIRSLDLESINSNYMQGSIYTEIKATPDGKIVYIDNIGECHDEFMYKYDVKDNKLAKVPFKEITDYFVKGSIFDKDWPLFEGVKSTTIAQVDDDSFAFILNNDDQQTATEYRIVIYNEKTRGYSLYLPFHNAVESQKVESPFRYDLAEIIKYKSRYVGDLMNTEKLAGLLPLPVQGFIRNFISLQTKEKPYGVTLYFEAEKQLTKAEIANVAVDADTIAKNSFIMFCMIDNLEVINYELRMSPTDDGILDDKSYSIALRVDRGHFEKLFNLSELGNDLNKMEEILINWNIYYSSDSTLQANELPEEASVTPEVSQVPVEMQTNTASSLSPDGKYRIEAYGVDKNITYGGMYPADGIRMIELSSGNIVWNMTPGYYVTDFLWSSDSHYVSVYYEGRIQGDTIVVDTMDMSQIILPGVVEIQETSPIKTTVNEFRSDPFIRAYQWLDNTTLQVNFQWSGAEDNYFKGSYDYDVVNKKMSNLQISSEPAG